MSESTEDGSGGTRYTVEQGDTLLSIAKKHEYRSWEAIWNHEDNKALREERGDPQVLCAGDTVVIPPRETQPIELETNKRHTLVVKSFKAMFRTVVRDDTGKPLANARYSLQIGDEAINGMTDEEGVIQLELDPDPQEGTLKIFQNTQPETVITWTLKLGNLDPITTLSGVKARLTNLGFSCGEINEEENEDLERALRDFQIVYRLPLTAEADDVTRQKLLYVHDKR